MRRGLVAVVGLIALAAGVGWLLDDATAPARATPPPEDAPAATRVETTPAKEEAASTRVPLSVETTDDDSAHAALDATAVLRVVDRESGAPVADAEVWVVLDSVRLATKPRPVGDALYRELGAALRSDADGEVRFALNENANIAAFSGDRYGHVYAEPAAPGRTARLTLELERDRSFRVLVRASTGEPVGGIPVQWRSEDEAGGSGWTILRTEADGIATFAHVQDQVRRRSGPFVHTVMPDVPGFTEPPVRIELDALPDEPIPFRLPETTMLVVHLVTHDGEPVWSGALLDIACAEAPDRSWTLGGTGHWRSRVVADREYALTVKERQWLERTVRVPQEAGEHRVDLRLPEDSGHRVHGRVLREDRVPFASSLLQAYVDGAHVGTTGTDDGGRFATLVPADATTLELRSRWSDADLIARAALDRRIDDLGDLVLQDVPLLVAGTCRRGGAPIARAPSMWIETATDRGWERRHDDWVLWSHGGGFSCRSPWPDGACRLVVKTLDEPIPFAPGTSDLVVELPAAGGLSAVVLVEPSFERGLDLQLRPHAGGDPHSGHAQRDGEDRVRFAWHDVPAGHYDLLVRGGADEVLQEIANVEVGPEAAPDPRLDGIDLRGRMRIVEVRVRAGDEMPVFGGVCVDTGLDGPWPYLSIIDGVCRIPTAAPSVDLLVDCIYHRERRISGVVDEAEVVLEPAPRLVLEVAHAPLPNDAYLGVDLAPLDARPGRTLAVRSTAGGYRSESESTPIHLSDTDSRYEFVIPAPGRFRVTATLLRTWHRDVPLRCSPAEVVVPDSGVEEAIRIEIAPQEIERALEASRPR